MKKLLLTSILGITLISIPTQAKTATTTANLNVRQYPTTNSKILDTLPKREEVEIFSCEQDNWNKIIFDNQEGYINNTYLDLNNNSESEIPEEENERLYEPSDFQWMGVLNYDGWRWTWYSERVLPGPGLNIPGRHTNEDGYVCDEDEYICLASSDLSKGTVVNTPLGYQGKVYDSGCAHGTLDVYTNW